MRRVFNGVLAVVVVMSISVPAEARVREERRTAPKRPDLIQILKDLVVRSFGDGLIAPRP